MTDYKNKQQIFQRIKDAFDADVSGVIEKYFDQHYFDEIDDILEDICGPYDDCCSKEILNNTLNLTTYSQKINAFSRLKQCILFSYDDLKCFELVSHNLKNIFSKSYNNHIVDVIINSFVYITTDQFEDFMTVQEDIQDGEDGIIIDYILQQANKLLLNINKTNMIQQIQEIVVDASYDPDPIEKIKKMIIETFTNQFNKKVANQIVESFKFMVDEEEFNEIDIIYDDLNEDVENSSIFTNILSNVKMNNKDMGYIICEMRNIVKSMMPEEPTEEGKEVHKSIPYSPPIISYRFCTTASTLKRTMIAVQHKYGNNGSVQDLNLIKCKSMDLYNKKPILLWLLDCFSRDRKESVYIPNKHNNNTIQDWWKQYRYTRNYMQSQLDVHHINYIMALDTFSKRLLPPLNFNVSYSPIINDSINSFMKYVIDFQRFLSNLDAIPIHFDLWIIPQSVIRHRKKPQKDLIDIHKILLNSLDSNEIQLANAVRKDYDQLDIDNDVTYMEMGEARNRNGEATYPFWNLEFILKKAGYKENSNLFVLDNPLKKYQVSGYDNPLKKYNRLWEQYCTNNNGKGKHKRFVLIIDRRNQAYFPSKAQQQLGLGNHIWQKQTAKINKTDNDWVDRLYLIMPKIDQIIAPKNENIEVFPESCLLASKDYLFPKHFMQSAPRNVSIGDVMNGYKFVISHHLFSKDCCKRYLFFGDGSIRFELEDMESVWTRFFVKNNNTPQIINQELVNDLYYTNREYPYQDIEFEKFRKELLMTKITPAPNYAFKKVQMSVPRSSIITNRIKDNDFPSMLPSVTPTTESETVYHSTTSKVIYSNKKTNLSDDLDDLDGFFSDKKKTKVYVDEKANDDLFANKPKSKQKPQPVAKNPSFAKDVENKQKKKTSFFDAVISKKKDKKQKLLLDLNSDDEPQVVYKKTPTPEPKSPKKNVPKDTLFGDSDDDSDDDEDDILGCKPISKPEPAIPKVSPKPKPKPKPTVTKSDRRKRTKKKIKIDGEEDNNNTLSQSLFSAPGDPLFASPKSKPIKVEKSRKSNKIGIFDFKKRTPKDPKSKSKSKPKSFADPLDEPEQDTDEFSKLGDIKIDPLLTDNKTITVLLSKDNQIQRDHFNDFQEFLNELHSSSLFIDSGSMQKQLDANNSRMVTRFVDIIQELIEFLKINNQQILNEMKIAIECQTYQPKKDKLDNIEPIWNHLNDCVCGLFNNGNQFLELRDEFVIVLMDIMWKCDQIRIEKDIILKLKNNINNNKINLHILKNDCAFKSLNKIRDILPGSAYFSSLCDSITRKENEINESVRKLNIQIDDNNILYKQKKDDIDSKRKQLTNIKVDVNNVKSAINESGRNTELVKQYHNQLVKIMDDDVRKINLFQDKFKNTTKPFRDKLDKQKCEYQELLSKLEESRKVTGIKGDNLIQEFLVKINILTWKSLRSCSRINQFKLIISTLRELSTQTMDNNNNRNISLQTNPFDLFHCKQYQNVLDSLFVNDHYSNGIMLDLSEVYSGNSTAFQYHSLIDFRGHGIDDIIMQNTFIPNVIPSPPPSQSVDNYTGILPVKDNKLTYISDPATIKSTASKVVYSNRIGGNFYTQNTTINVKRNLNISGGTMNVLQCSISAKNINVNHNGALSTQNTKVNVVNNLKASGGTVNAYGGSYNIDNMIASNNGNINLKDIQTKIRSNLDISGGKVNVLGGSIAANNININSNEQVFTQYANADVTNNLNVNNGSLNATRNNINDEAQDAKNKTSTCEPELPNLFTDSDDDDPFDVNTKKKNKLQPPPKEETAIKRLKLENKPSKQQLQPFLNDRNITNCVQCSPINGNTQSKATNIRRYTSNLVTGCSSDNDEKSVNNTDAIVAIKTSNLNDDKLESLIENENNNLKEDFLNNAFDDDNISCDNDISCVAVTNDEYKQSTSANDVNNVVLSISTAQDHHIESVFNDNYIPIHLLHSLMESNETSTLTPNISHRDAVLLQTINCCDAIWMALLFQVISAVDFMIRCSGNGTDHDDDYNQQLPNNNDNNNEENNHSGNSGNGNGNNVNDNDNSNNNIKGNGSKGNKNQNQKQNNNNNNSNNKPTEINAHTLTIPQDIDTKLKENGEEEIFIGVKSTQNLLIKYNQSKAIYEMKSNLDDFKLNKQKSNNYKKKNKKQHKKKMKDIEENGDLNPNHRTKHNINISLSITKYIASNSISTFRNARDVDCYLDVSTAMQYNDGQPCKFTHSNGKKYILINYDLKYKNINNNNDIRYSIIELYDKPHGEHKGKMMLDAYQMTHQQLIDFGVVINTNKYPKSSRNTTRFKSQLIKMNYVESVLNNKKMKNEIVTNTKWCHIRIYKRKSSHSRLTFSIQQETLIKRLNNLATDIDEKQANDNIELVPIVQCGRDSHHIEFIWIVSVNISPLIHIGISLRCNQNDKNDNNSLPEVTGIHLDKEYILNKNKLVDANQDHVVLNKFTTIINDLKIGNPDGDKYIIDQLTKDNTLLKYKLRNCSLNCQSNIQTKCTYNSLNTTTNKILQDLRLQIDYNNIVINNLNCKLKSVQNQKISLEKALKYNENQRIDIKRLKLQNKSLKQQLEPIQLFLENKINTKNGNHVQSDIEDCKMNNCKQSNEHIYLKNFYNQLLDLVFKKRNLYNNALHLPTMNSLQNQSNSNSSINTNT